MAILPGCGMEKWKKAGNRLFSPYKDSHLTKRPAVMSAIPIE
jgi:hypothetical protein